MDPAHELPSQQDGSRSSQSSLPVDFLNGLFECSPAVGVASLSLTARLTVSLDEESQLLRSPWQIRMKKDGGTSDHLSSALGLKLTMCRLAQRAEKDLQTYLTGKESTFPDIAHFLAQYIFHTPQEGHI